MSSNILTAIKQISDFKINQINEFSKKYTRTQINSVRKQIKYYVKDAISGSLKTEKEKKESEPDKRVFSYLGNKNNPPDMIIKDGDAFIIKIIQTYKSSLTFTNSPPKDHLNWNDPWILKNCRTVDGGQWTSKDIFYVTGWIEKGKIKYLYFLHGLCYAAKEEIYNQKIRGLKENIEKYLAAEGLEASKIVDGLGRINKIDPLGITDLRINGIWKTQNPLRVFSNTYNYDKKQDFMLIALMLKDKFDSFPKKHIDALTADSQIKLENVKIRNPNNPAKELDAKLVTLSW